MKLPKVEQVYSAALEKFKGCGGEVDARDFIAFTIDYIASVQPTAKPKPQQSRKDWYADLAKGLLGGRKQKGDPVFYGCYLVDTNGTYVSTDAKIMVIIRNEKPVEVEKYEVVDAFTGEERDFVYPNWKNIEDANGVIKNAKTIDLDISRLVSDNNLNDKKKWNKDNFAIYFSHNNERIGLFNVLLLRNLLKVFQVYTGKKTNIKVRAQFDIKVDRNPSIWTIVGDDNLKIFFMPMNGKSFREGKDIETIEISE